jgi:glycosyltransferase involved in cell wall biosynthesis
MGEHMDITVILCTYNRCDSLASALESVAVSRLPHAVSWEVLVVDNNSTDRTREVVERFASGYPGRFRYAFEPRPGKSNALNAALHDTKAEILAFMDDDVQVEADWLHMLTRIFQDQKYAGAGGRILPGSEFTPPAWLEVSGPYALAPLAMFDLGPTACRLQEPPFGTNMAFRREVFSRYGDFRRDLGPRPGSEIRSEDTEFGMRLLAGGELLWYEPAAVVYHAIAPNRVTRHYFLKWWFDKARADIRERGVPPGTRWFVGGVPLLMIRRLIVWTLRWLLRFRPGPRFSAKLCLWTVVGAMKECRDQSRSRNLQQDGRTPPAGKLRVANHDSFDDGFHRELSLIETHERTSESKK